MYTYFLALLTFLATATAQSETQTERVKITGLYCDGGKVVIALRSFEKDRNLFLAKDIQGEPEPFELRDEYCRSLSRNMEARLKGKIQEVDFQIDRFSKVETIPLPPHNPCRPGHTKCDDQGDYADRVFDYERTEAFINGYRFFNQVRIERSL